MKLKPNHIDDIFQQRLHDAEVAPPAFVWTNVERELQKRKRRRFIFWLFAGAVAGAGIWALLAKNEKGSSFAVKQEVFSEKNKETAAAAAEMQNPSETQKPEPAKNAAVSASSDTPTSPIETGATASKNWSAKGAELKLPDLETAILQNEETPQTSPIATSTDNALPADQAVQAQRGLNEFLLLENKQLEPLAFSRKETLPQVKAKIFIRKKKDPKYCYDFAQNPNVWMLDGYIGPSFAKRAFSASSPALEQYRQQREATETQDWAFNAGLRGSLLLGRHFLFRTGLHYEQSTDVFEHFDPNYVKYIVEIINKPGEPPIIDTVDVDYGESYVKTYNRYGLLDIPLEVGGEVRRGRLGLSLNAGVSFNVLFWKRGDILSTTGEPTPFTPGTKGAEEVFRPRTGLSTNASAQLFFHLKPRLRVFAEPYFRKTLKPVTLDNHPIEQRNSSWGIKIGATKILN
jgi:hypothetical protein